jgi:hypothetical protein
MGSLPYLSAQTVKAMSGVKATVEIMVICAFLAFIAHALVAV